MNILISYAIAAERVEVHFSGCQIRYCETGIGKVNAALAVYSAVLEQRPDCILNMGTAGSVTHPVGTIVSCGRFLDRDMEQLKDFGVPYQHEFVDQLVQMPLFQGLDLAHVCNTGDSFVTEIIDQADVVDMENFAVAEVCSRAGIPLVSVKYITDRIGENSIAHWEEKLHDANVGLQSFFDRWSGEWDKHTSR